MDTFWLVISDITENGNTLFDRPLLCYYSKFNGFDYYADF